MTDERRIVPPSIEGEVWARRRIVPDEVEEHENDGRKMVGAIRFGFLTIFPNAADNGAVFMTGKGSDFKQSVLSANSVRLLANALRRLFYECKGKR